MIIWVGDYLLSNQIEHLDAGSHHFVTLINDGALLLLVVGRLASLPHQVVAFSARANLLHPDILAKRIKPAEKSVQLSK